MHLVGLLPQALGQIAAREEDKGRQSRLDL